MSEIQDVRLLVCWCNSYPNSKFLPLVTGRKNNCSAVSPSSYCSVSAGKGRVEKYGA